MKVTLSSRARHDLEGIRNYIEQDNPARAISFVDELRDIMKRLADMPRAFPLVPRYEHHGIRRRSYKRYGILYSVEPDHIFVHRIIGPGQDHDTALQLT
ncbi:type II toxin-antitoxin system RelE/ParE family toxin [Sphingobium sp. Ant17]|uniref:type II toxin-antitoxin system RelE/ParE family toxin n=1 Tax=Sphingobium sp. Ant17 TaxID=1461752 RepID=UPI0004519AA2|nr:type II toxin-antitoxin system RelE/ParE family toxin [Sphingobium sp. Ant17]EXS68000.1 plasmid stabilization protein [Sphingobium sp. Ant17]|tara:strand:- start:3615 stop:3911 length:297 start_codon:yes stop_codon:yes gene_type:complete